MQNNKSRNLLPGLIVGLFACAYSVGVFLPHLVSTGAGGALLLLAVFVLTVLGGLIALALVR